MRRLLLGLLLFPLACASTSSAPDGGAASDAAEVADAGAVDTGPALPDSGYPPYRHIAPPSTPAPEFLQRERWKTHFVEDLRPFWMMPEAFGTPEGNFPTYRGMSGQIVGPSDRRPRMIGRQVYAYSMGYLLTGEARMLELAHAGMLWLKDHARDPRGGCHTLLSSTGAAMESDKTSQDIEYCALGFAAYYFVTRNPEAERELLALRDTLFDPRTFWDAEHKRIKDAMTPDLATEVDVENDGGWELVAQLDAMNGFLLLAQPVLSTAERRAQFLGDLETLGQTLVDTFYADGIFWGVHTKKGQYQTKHVDFGHTLKSYWMLRETDKRLPHTPFRALLETNAPVWIEKALDRPNGRWAKRPLSSDAIDYGSDWWIYAEADQLAATLQMGGLGTDLDAARAETQRHWVEDYVDRTRPAREVVSGIRQNGSWVYPWPNQDNAKCNQWKNGFHSTEHALVSYLAGAWRENQPAELHFAVEDATGFIARPYMFLGKEQSRMETGTVMVAGRALKAVTVRFVELY